MTSKKNEREAKVFEFLEEFARAKVDTLPLLVRYNFVTELHGLILEGKRDKAGELFLAFLKGKYQPSTSKQE